MGPQGQQGIQGIQGPAGAAGAAGQSGLNGLNGQTGQQGPQGLTGPQGPRGETGLQGLLGLTGPQGLLGPQGAQGEMGVSGQNGPQGEKGDQGPPGPEGPQGQPGQSDSPGMKTVLVGDDGQEYESSFSTAEAFVEGTSWLCYSSTRVQTYNGHLTPYGWDTSCYYASRFPLNFGPKEDTKRELIKKRTEESIFSNTGLVVNISAFPDDVFVYQTSNCSGQASGYVLDSSYGLKQYTPTATKLQNRIFVMSKSNWSLSEIKSFKDVDGCHPNSAPSWPQTIKVVNFDSGEKQTFKYYIVSLREVNIPQVTLIDAYEEWR